jgi:O-antigen/teichoic acid export membrane protein
MALSSVVFGGSGGAVLRATATIFAGAAAAKLIGIAAMPLLTRIYSPEDFGVLAVFTAFAALLAPFMTLSYCNAIPLPKTDQMALNVMALAAAIMVAGAGLFFIIFFFISEPILRAFSMEVTLPYWWLIGAVLVGGSLYQILSMWAVRRRDYRLIAKTHLTQSVSSSVIKISLGLLGVIPLGLLLGHITKQSGGIFAILRQCQKDLRQKRHAVSFSRMRLAARRYQKMPIYKLPSQVFARFSTEGPVLFIAVIFDARTTGQFGLAAMAVALPMTLLARTTSKAFYSEIAALGRRRPQQIRNVTLGALGRLSALAAAPALVLFMFGPQIFALVFGEGWSEAGQFVSYFALFMVFKFVAYPAMHIPDVFDRQGVNLQLNVQRFVMLSAVFAASWLLSLPPAETVLIFSIALAAHYAFIVLRCIGCIPAQPDS